MDFRRAITSDPAFLRALARLEAEPCPDLPVLTAKVKLLWRCNLSCEFCKLPGQTAIMSRQTALELGRELAGAGLRKVHFSGGEILLHPDCFTILADWSALGAQVNLTSNGLLLDKQAVRRLEDAGVHAVSLSIDSADRRIHDRLRGHKGAHKAVVRAAELIAQRGRIRLRINTVVTARTIRGLGEMRELVRSCGQRVAWKLIPVDTVDPAQLPSRRAIERFTAEAATWQEPEDRAPLGGRPEEFREAAAGRYGFRPLPCFAPWYHLFFTPEGDCYPCCMARALTQPLGRFPGHSVRHILAGEPMRRLRTVLASGGSLPPCSRCDDFLEERQTIVDLLLAAGTVP